jgi:death-on-curing protein
MNYLTPLDLVSIAERETGARVSVDDAAVQAVAAYPASVEAGHERFPGVQVKAAALMTDLLQRRPFPEGNERIALLAAIVFLNLNGWDVEASESDLAELADLAAQGSLSLTMVATAFEAITVRLLVTVEPQVDPSS